MSERHDYSRAYPEDVRYLLDELASSNRERDEARLLAGTRKAINEVNLETSRALRAEVERLRGALRASEAWMGSCWMGDNCGECSYCLARAALQALDSLDTEDVSG